nr:signal peptidase complex catalytic subunit SEC11 [Andalucia godoyi]|eukprot:ANDGO_03944.mRNA.1 Signal peptidase complex catalytic subunit SEC11
MKGKRVPSGLPSALNMFSRSNISQVFSLLLVGCSALMIWKSLMAFTNTESPIVVVLSGSMEPGIRRGDILFLNDVRSNSAESLEIGDIVVFKIAERDIPIVHRIVQIVDHHNNVPNSGKSNEKQRLQRKSEEDANTGKGRKWSGKELILTKGDNNPTDDRGLYADGQMWLTRDDLVGKAVGSVPYLGMVTIYMNDYPWMRFGLLGGLAVLVLLGKE